MATPTTHTTRGLHQVRGRRRRHEAGWKAPSRRGRTSITAFVDVQTHQQFRILSIEQRRSGQQLLIEAVNDLFRKYGKEPIAQ